MTPVGGSWNTESMTALFNGVPGDISFCVLVFRVAGQGYL